MATPLVIASLRGGMNNTDHASAIPDDQCVLAQNIEYFESMLGDRRLGTAAVTLPSFLSSCDRVPFLFRHLPDEDEGNAELWALGVTGSTPHLGRKTSSWQTELTFPDTPDLTGDNQYRWQAVSLHGKLHLAYEGNKSRPKVWTGTTFRLSGLAQPSAAPTGANTGSVGTYAGTRYFRVREVEVDGSGVVLRRSEPSDSLTFSPSGTNTGAVVTKPADMGEGATHWELEASVDDAFYYRIARTVVGTATYTDTTDFSTGYAAAGTLSEDVGAYSLLPSPRYLTADGDRLLWANAGADQSSRVGWTPVFNAPGNGNDERMDTTTDPTLDLDTFKGGEITGLSEPVLGGIWVFKTKAIYKLTRTGKASTAYEADQYTDAMGAVHGSVVSGVDERGSPCIYFIDPHQGPGRIGFGGMTRCGEDLRATWKRLNITASAVVVSAVFYPAKKQVHWNLALDSDASPSVRIVLHTDKSRSFDDGVRKGWALWTGNIAKALTMCLFADNVEANTTRNSALVPFIGLEGLGLVHRCDTGDDDNGVAFVSTIQTKPYIARTILDRFMVAMASVCAVASATAKITMKIVRNFGVETTSTVADVSLAPSLAGESDVVVLVDNLKGAELNTGALVITDGTGTTQWKVNRVDLVQEVGQTAFGPQRSR